MFLFLFSIITVTAHEQIGVAASNISGYGISYHYIFSENYKAKLTGFYSGETGYTNSGTNYDYSSIGIEGQKTVFKTETIRLYGLLGISYYGTKSYHYRDDYGNGINITDAVKDTYTGGAGVGIELPIIGPIYFNVDVGLTYSFHEHHYYTNIKGNDIPPYRNSSNIGGGGGVGISYRF
jgi:hypothetical protein